MERFMGRSGVSIFRLICLALFFQPGSLFGAGKSRSSSRRLRMGNPERAEGVKARSPEGSRVAAALMPEHV
jgi:hypothetical protein